MVCNPGYNVSQDSQTIFPCEEFYAPNHRQMVCQRHYLYIEASGLSEYEERFAKLTRRFSRIETPEVCFVFWYHMYGFNI
ncbi:unnamed protein product, partial [Nesidiocoris tenuis]